MTALIALACAGWMVVALLAGMTLGMVIHRADQLAHHDENHDEPRGAQRRLIP